MTTTTKCESCGAPVRLRAGTDEDPMPKWWDLMHERVELQVGGGKLVTTQAWMQHTPERCRARRMVSGS